MPCQINFGHHCNIQVANKNTKTLNIYSYTAIIIINGTFACLWQNCHFDRGLAQYKHAILPLSFLGINTTLLGFPKRCITLVYLKGLKSYQPSKFISVDFLSFYLVKWTFRLHFYWQLLSRLRYTKVIPFWKAKEWCGNNA